MCDICLNGRRDEAMKKAMLLSKLLLKMSKDYKKLALGKLKPHSEEMDETYRFATKNIRDLAIDVQYSNHRGHIKKYFSSMKRKEDIA